MKRTFLSTINCTVLVVLTLLWGVSVCSCSKDEDNDSAEETENEEKYDPSRKNQIVVGNDTYSVGSTADAMIYSALQHDCYVVSIYLYDTGITSNQLSFNGDGVILVVALGFKAQGSIEYGTYEYAPDIKLKSMFSSFLSTGKVSGSRLYGVGVTAGKVVISKATDDNPVIKVNCTLSDGRKVSAYFHGDLRSWQ